VIFVASIALIERWLARLITLHRANPYISASQMSAVGQNRPIEKICYQSGLAPKADLT
jgi:hypothetical protein